MNNKMMYSNGGVTEKTDKQANRLVKKRKKIRDRRDKVESKDKKTKLGKFIKKKRLQRLDRREDRVQDKINENPTAQKWRKDGEKKKKKRKKGLLPIPKNIITENFKFMARKKKKLKKGGAKPDYLDMDGDGNRKESMKSAISSKKKMKKGGKKKMMGGGMKKMYKSGGFNTGAGSWIEPSSVASID
jgi:hypothetical protein